MIKKNRAKAQVKKGFPGWTWGVIALAVVLAVALGVYLNSPPASTSSYPAEISIAQAAEKRDQGAFILDVRQPEEWEQVHIPEATLIPLGELPNRLNEVPKDMEIVVVCRSGNRSAQGRDILRSAGYTQVTSMAGGVTQWQAQGLETATGQ